jgi:hypothetical protein
VQNSTIYNYADDNAVSYCDYDINKVVNTLEADSLKLINLFSINLKKANPDKFQAIAIGKKTNKHKLTFNLNGNNITCEDNVKLHGVTIDSDLNFNNHISEICRQIKQTKKSIKAAKYFETDWQIFKQVR